MCIYIASQNRAYIGNRFFDVSDKTGDMMGGVKEPSLVADGYLMPSFQ
jgi:hypothetical protein